MSAAIRIGYVNRPTLTESEPSFADLSLNWVIRCACPKPVRQDRIQASWVCSGTWDWTKTVARSGSMPAASSWAAARSTRSRSSAGSCSMVSACRSATP